MAEFIECRLLDTGYCLTRECNLYRGGRFDRVRCHSMAALLRHPVEGWGLWDTGYAPRLLEETRRFPNRFYRWGAPLPPQPDKSVVSQLAAHHLRPEDIKWIVLSHLHGDHIAGVLDFPLARLFVTQEARNYAAQRRGFAAVTKGYLPGLLPEDFGTRACLIQTFNGTALTGLGRTFDLFEDGAALLFPLPGHARGQIGMLAKVASGSILFAADSVYHRDSIRDERPPGILTNVIADSPAQVLSTIRGLREFTRANPHVRVYPTHCAETYREWFVEGAQSC